MSSTLTDLTAATTWSGTDLFYALVGGNSRKIAAAKFLVAETSSSLAMQDSTTAQTFRLYRTFTDSSNYERLALQSGSAYFELAVQTAGTGTDSIDLRLTASGNGQVVIPNDGIGTGATPLAIINNVSTTNLGGLSILAPNMTTTQNIRFSIGKAESTGNVCQHIFKWVGDNDATNEFKLEFWGGSVPLLCLKGGTVKLFSHLSTPAGGSTDARLLFGSTTGFGIYIGSGAPTVSAAQGSLYLRSDGSSASTRLYGNTNGSTTWTNFNAIPSLTEEAANIISHVNSTSAQTLRVYRTFTDSSNYERLALQSGSGYMELAAETAGTGTDDIEIRLTPSGNRGLVMSNSASAAFLDGIKCLGPNMTAGQQQGITTGKSGSTGNSGGWGFIYQGNNDATNAIRLDFYGDTEPRIICYNGGAINLFRNLGTVPAGGSTNARILFGTSPPNFGIYYGSGAPTVSAASGSLYIRTDGSSSSTRLYINSSGSTTWVNVTTAS
jgi:hypothetical protein